jgi:hypothetical protein
LIVPAAIVVDAFVAALFYFPRAKTEALAIKSLAVLPLKSLDAGENYLGWGSPTKSQENQPDGRVNRASNECGSLSNEDVDAHCRTAAKPTQFSKEVQRSATFASER